MPSCFSADFIRRLRPARGNPWRQRGQVPPAGDPVCPKVGVLAQRVDWHLGNLYHRGACPWPRCSVPWHRRRTPHPGKSLLYLHWISLKDWQEPHLHGKYQQLGINRSPVASVAGAVSLSHCSCKFSRIVGPWGVKALCWRRSTQSAAGASAAGRSGGGNYQCSSRTLFLFAQFAYLWPLLSEPPKKGHVPACHLSKHGPVFADHCENRQLLNAG